MHVKETPLAADHDRKPCRKYRLFVQGAFHVAAVRTVEQFQFTIDRVGDARRVRRAGIGLVGINEPAACAPGPDRAATPCRA